MAKTGMSKGRIKRSTGEILPVQLFIDTEPPAGLGPKGLELFKTLVSRASWLDPELDRYMIEQVSRLADDMEQAREEIALSGRYQQIPNGSKVRAAAVVDLEKLAITQNSYLSALGLTPTDRARLGLANLTALNTLSELEIRRNERASKNNSAQ
jgi:P27 family predicted phage terminase small subunit